MSHCVQLYVLDEPLHARVGLIESLHMRVLHDMRVRVCLQVRQARDLLSLGDKLNATIDTDCPAQSTFRCVDLCIVHASGHHVLAPGSRSKLPGHASLTATLLPVLKFSIA